MTICCFNAQCTPGIYTYLHTLATRRSSDLPVLGPDCLRGTQGDVLQILAYRHPGHRPVPAGPGDQPAGRRPARCHGAGGPGMSGDTAMTSGPGEAPLLAVRDLYVDLPLEQIGRAHV